LSASGVHDNHQLSNFPIARIVENQHGFAVAIIPHMLYDGKGSSILPSPMEAYKTKMHGVFIYVGGTRGLRQWINISMLFPVLMKIGILELFFMTTSTLPLGLKTCSLSLGIPTWTIALMSTVLVISISM